MNLETKRAIILEARLARRKQLSESANPYPEGSEAFEVWQTFYRMVLADELRNDLIDSEYEASAY
ncbi:MAG: hypothetical protein COS35_11040 [Zetaproteobacteria bacterium CG02_land_8_20_14_3_00_50_9]|nr:MAG: hypothetical protein AUJ56_01340 [Zetaproteobacteria bacterium CG1_02_49_23]PIQ30986.1 MAG: hypothetical protein COW62_10665 [Zetaproteobacteria bacterium CG17_big_fil_post_rev_8_21_14_2_50_50_13]PIV29617.1 MAG: hypothetical protein COS35_11040 [Zetaproteobacteria bacterium CG02_land_8_20_14_3_00_50_9]PIY56870.1 MAG: hypothetical protein COZ00_01655 [Zetaproteobacteria bacterium CG_4_10_14_0_8_um_filter_49_80]